MNPFRDGIVADPWRNQQSDVPDIHHAVFQRCLDGLAHVRQQRSSAGLLIHGEAGSGKTHLLSRLRATLTPKAPTATDREETLFVWVRLQTSPRMIWRTMRRTLVNDWFRPVAGTRSQFDRILSHRLAEIRVAEGDLEPWIEFMQENHPEDLSSLIDQIATSLDLDRNTAVAFEHLAFDRHRRDLRAWLSGDSLPESSLEKLNLTQEEGTDEEREEESQRVVTMLCRLAGKSLPIVIGLDQVEALQLSPRDPDALYAFGKLISTLHDNTDNTLIISCVQSAFVSEFKDHARSADYDRTASLGAFTLDTLNPTQANALIASRLESAATSAESNGDTHADRSATWPLSEAEFDSLFTQDRPLTPRRLLAICADRYEFPRSGDLEVALPSMLPPVDPVRRIASFLEQKWDEHYRKRSEQNRPEQTEEIIRHGFPILNQLYHPDRRLVTDEQLQDVSLIFEVGLARVGLALCAQSNMNSLVGRLKRLKTQLATRRIQRLVLIRDQRLPISAGAKAARTNLEDLESQGATVLYPPVEDLVAIDTLRDLISDAKSGDLACDGETVAPAEVMNWMRDHLPKSLQQFASNVLGQ